MGMGKFGQGDPTKTQHQISSSNTGDNHIAGNLIIEGDLSVSGSTSFASGGSARSVAGDTDNGIITWKTSDDTFIVESGVLVTGDGHLSSSGKGYFEKDVEIADNLLVSGSIAAGNGITLLDDKTITFGTDNDVTIQYDADGDSYLELAANRASAHGLMVENTTVNGSANVYIRANSGGGNIRASDDGISTEFGNKLSFMTDDVSGLDLMMAARASNAEFQIYTGGDAAANKRVVVTKDGHLSASQKLYVEKDVEIADNLLVSGSGTFKGGGVTIEASGGDCILTLKDTDGGSTGDRTYIIGTDSSDNQVWQIGDSNSGTTNATFLANLAQSGDNVGNAFISTKASDGGYIRLAPRRDDNLALTVETTGQVTIQKRLSQSVDGGSNVFLGDVIIGAKNAPGDGSGTFYNLMLSGSLTSQGNIDCYRLSQSSGAGFTTTNVLMSDLVLGKQNGGNNANLEVSGNVGIGMTPAKPLDITAATNGFPIQLINDGDATARKGIKIQCGADTIGGGDTNVYVLCNDGNGDASGQLQDAGGTFSAADTSDRRLKQNIVDTELAGLDVINSMQVRDFEWKKSGIKTTGFIAQEMKEAFAMATSGDESGDPAEDPMMIMRDVIVVPLVKAVQELSAKVKELEDQLKNQ